MPRIQGYREEKRINYWDSAELAYMTPEQKLFGPANIGDDALCNLQVPYSISYDQSSFLNHWYARSVGIRTETAGLAFEAWAHQAVAWLFIGEKPHWTKPVHDLLRTGPWEPPSRHLERMTEEEAARMVVDRAEGHRLLVVPVRQNVRVVVVSDGDLLGALAHELTPIERDRPGANVRAVTPRLWIHVEGVSRRDVP